MTLRRSLTCGLIVMAGLCGYVHIVAAPEAVSSMARMGEVAPDFAIKDVYGKGYTLSEFKGRIIVLEWLNPACPFSKARHEDKTMQNTYARYAGKGVIWLGIDSSHFAKAEAVRVHMAEKHLNYPVLLDADGKVGQQYGAKTTPHMFVIDKAGKLVYSGAIDDDAGGGKSEKETVNYVALAIDSLLAGKDIPKPQTRSYGCSVKYAR